jgi:hypothetical protein
VSFGKGWFDTRPPVLECIREITRSFRDDEPIWVSSFTLRVNQKDKDNPTKFEAPGSLKGKAADRNFINAIVDRLQKDKNFSEVRYQEIREAGGNSRDVSFSLNFIFKSTEQAP